MIFKSVPGRVVHKRVRKPGGGHRIKAIFKFDENGFAEIDETKVTNPDMVKLKSLFKVVDSKELVEVNDGLQEKDEEETKVDVNEMSWHELKSYAASKGITATKKVDILKELEV